MARPTKPAATLTPCSQTKDEIAARQEMEQSLRGVEAKPRPPKHLTKKQKAVFNRIVKLLAPSKILGTLDDYILAQCAISIDRLQYIENQINEDPAQLENRELINARDKYARDFYRGCNELSLSPQARAKLANTCLLEQQKQEDPVRKALEGAYDAG